MALAAATVWEVRAAGADTNGGGFVTGAAGTDWSQQDAAQYSVTDAVTAGTTTITSATANFGTDVVGNILYIEGGTGAVVAGWYQIMSRTNSTTIVVDRSTGLTAGTGVTLTIGGALLTLAQLLTNNSVAGMTSFIKAGTYSIGTGLVVGTGGSTSVVTRFTGYTTTRTDKGRPTILATAGITLLTIGAGGHGYRFENLIFDGDAVASTNGINVSAGQWGSLFNCKVMDMAGYGVSQTQACFMDSCEVTGCAGTAGVRGATWGMVRCYIHDNTVTGALMTGGPIIDCIFANNTGASSEGLYHDTINSALSVVGCVFYGNGRDGFRQVGSPNRLGGFYNNIFMNNAAYGVNLVGTTATSFLANMANNAYYNNTLGERALSLPAEAGAVTLTGDPFTNAAGGDFSLDNVANQGAACRATGLPGVIAATTGNRDIGVAQHADPAGAGGGGIISKSLIAGGA